MATIAEKIRARGVEEGKIIAAKALLSSQDIKLSESDLIELVQRITGLTIEKIKELCNID